MQTRTNHLNTILFDGTVLQSWANRVLRNKWKHKKCNYSTINIRTLIGRISTYFRQRTRQYNYEMSVKFIVFKSDHFSSTNDTKKTCAFFMFHYYLYVILADRRLWRSYRASASLRVYSSRLHRSNVMHTSMVRFGNVKYVHGKCLSPVFGFFLSPHNYCLSTSVLTIN